MIDLEAIKARLAAATSEPWKLLGGGEYIYPIGVLVTPDDGGVNDADAALIVNAPSDLAALIAEVERLREAVKPAVTSALAEHGWTCTAHEPDPDCDDCREAYAEIVALVLTKLDGVS